MICPNCESENRADATFCLECGSPLDEETMAARPAPHKPVAPEAASFDLTRLLKPLRWSWSVRLLVLIGIIALVINWMGSTVQQSDSDLYHAARQAQDEHRWHAAATMFQQLTAKSYYDSATHYNEVETQAKTFDDLYGKGSYAENHNDDVLAAYYYNQANQIEPGYYAVDVTLARLRRTNGRLLYRIPTGSRAGLYVTEADGGGIVLKIPESSASSVVLATSPDGRQIVFSDRSDGTLHLYVKDTVSYVTVAIDPPHVVGSGRYPEQNVTVALFNSGASLLVLDGGGFGFSNSESGSPSSALAYSFDLGTRQSNYIGVVDAVAYPGYYDKLIYYSDGIGDLHSYEAATDKSNFAFTPPEHIYQLQELGHDRLLYAASAGITATLYTVNIGQWQQPRELIALSDPERPYHTLQPNITVAPDTSRLFLWYMSRAKGTESYLLDLSGQGEARVLRYNSGERTAQPAMVAFSNSGRSLLFNTVASPEIANSTPRSSLIVLAESNFDYFFTYPFIENDPAHVVESAGFLNEEYIYYIANQNGATHEFNVGDIMLAPIAYPNRPIALATVNTDTISNWQPALLMPDQHTMIYCGNVNNSQGIYINDTDGQQPLKIMDEAVAFWRLGGQQ